MKPAWTPIETSTHQDHVVAHVLGATVLGYFIFAEALYILLDIGFIWTIFVDGQMGLLPHPVAINELKIDSAGRQQLQADIEVLLGSTEVIPANLRRLSVPSFAHGMTCLISGVEVFSGEQTRRLIITGEESRLAIETSLLTGEVQVMTLANDEKNEASEASGGVADLELADLELADVAKSEHEYLHQRLREELGREPNEAELNDWLRQHTEGY
ncbi:MAG: hypothetical protein QOJ88_1561 [Pyrinomonadaceae bacterium]|nr:hypothetical protein [Pyrinomonadaceae bacterium]